MSVKTLSILSAAALTAVACSSEAPDPSGDIEIVEDVSEIQVGQTINLRWTSENADRVYIGLSADGREAVMLSPAGFDPSGTQAFEVDETAFSFEEDDDVDVTFKLMAVDDDDDGEYETLDEETIEVKRAGM